MPFHQDVIGIDRQPTLFTKSTLLRGIRTRTELQHSESHLVTQIVQIIHIEKSETEKLKTLRLLSQSMQLGDSGYIQ